MRASRLTAPRTRMFSTALPRRVQIYEVGARDGLQNEPTSLDVATRAAFVGRLSQTGVAAVEAAAFVSPKAVPQMYGGADVMKAVLSGSVNAREHGVDYPVLVPNLRGFESAVASGARSVAVMTAASDTFSRNNVNSTIAQAKDRALAIAAEGHKRGIAVRGYLSCALGCPFEGDVAPAVVAEIAKALYEGGCYEIVISDTIGTGTPGGMHSVLQHVLPHVPIENLAVHCHDTYGQALANIYCALQHGVATIDSSAAGLGGCPFAGPGAAGNVATEDVVYMLDGLGIESGVDFEAVVSAGEHICKELGRKNASKAALAYLRRRPTLSGIAPCDGPTLSMAPQEEDEQRPLEAASAAAASAGASMSGAAPTAYPGLRPGHTPWTALYASRGARDAP